jgi:hypothetical protein
MLNSSAEWFVTQTLRKIAPRLRVSRSGFAPFAGAAFAAERRAQLLDVLAQAASQPEPA